MKKFIFNFFRFYPLTGSIRETVKILRNADSKKEVPVKLFGKTDIILRGGYTDISVLKATFIDRYHRSPFNLGLAPVIVDLGSNIGLTLLDYHYEYPDARLIGVELDAANFRLLQFNTSSLKNCDIINAGIWKSDGEISYSGPDSQSFSIAEKPSEGGNKNKAITIDSLFSRYGISKVDFLKMDIEGAEEQIILESDCSNWISRVKIISIEVHKTAKYENRDMMNLIRSRLEKSGFIVFESALHWSSLLAIKNNIQ